MIQNGNAKIHLCQPKAEVSIVVVQEKNAEKDYISLSIFKEESIDTGREESEEGTGGTEKLHEKRNAAQQTNKKEQSEKKDCTQNVTGGRELKKKVSRTVIKAVTVGREIEKTLKT